MQSPEKKPSNNEILVDARGFLCPMPLLKAKQALNKIEKGSTIRLLATDPGSVKDIHSFTKLSAHILIDFIEEKDHYIYLLQKGVA